MSLQEFIEATRPNHVVFPPKSRGGENEEIATDSGVIVIVGANGSGKSRLGAWIELESREAAPTHRISAQKIIEVPNSFSGESLTSAKSAFLYGSGDLVRHGYGRENLYKMRRSHRWGDGPTTHTLSDYHQLLTYLFTDHSAEATRYHQESQSTVERIEPRSTRLQTAKKIWDSAIPHRELHLGGFELHAHNPQIAGQYEAREMSDGERIVFYLAGQCLAAEPGSIIIIDEPELHLHRSIQSRLWNAIESERPDCIFVYITHDLDLAASRNGAAKIVVTDYDGQHWNWSPIPGDSTIPDQVLLEIMGSRKPVLFCEGAKGGIDDSILSRAYESHTVIPIGSCEHVIHATASLQSNSALHHLTACGIVDRDHRSPAEIAGLEYKRVYTLAYSEIENLLLDPTVVCYVASYLSLPIDETLRSIKDLVLQRVVHNRESLESHMAAACLERIARSFTPGISSPMELMSSVQSFKKEFDGAAILQSSKDTVNEIVYKQDYTLALQVYDNKGLVEEVSRFFRLGSGEYPKFVLRLLKDATHGPQLAAILGTLLPELN